MKTHLMQVGGIYKDKNDRLFFLVSMWHGYKEYIELYSVTDDKIITVDIEKMRMYLDSGALVFYSPNR